MKKLAEIQKTLKAPKTQFNKFGNYYYRSCEDILEAVKPLLGDHSLILTDDIMLIGDRYYVKATVKLFDGDGKFVIENSAFAREQEQKKGQDASQITGSASSYARKYALNGMFLIDDTKDADATNTHGADDKKANPQPNPTAKQPQQTPTSKPNSQFGNNDKFAFLNQMKEMKEKLGEEEYYRILGNNGFEKANQINDRPTAIKVYKEMIKAADNKQQE